MADNKDLDPPPPQDISNVFAAADLLSCLSSDSAKYKCACLKAKLILSYILSAGGCPDACSRVLSIVLNHKETAFIMALTDAIFPKNMPMQLPYINKRKTILSNATSIGNIKKQI